MNPGVLYSVLKFGDANTNEKCTRPYKEMVVVKNARKNYKSKKEITLRTPLG